MPNMPRMPVAFQWPSGNTQQYTRMLLLFLQEYIYSFKYGEDGVEFDLAADANGKKKKFKNAKDKKVRAALMVPAVPPGGDSLGLLTHLSVLAACRPMVACSCFGLNCKCKQTVLHNRIHHQ